MVKMTYICGRFLTATGSFGVCSVRSARGLDADACKHDDVLQHSLHHLRDAVHHRLHDGRWAFPGNKYLGHFVPCCNVEKTQVLLTKNGVMASFPIKSGTILIPSNISLSPNC